MKTKQFPLKVRLQWDPSYYPNGEVVKGGRRAIQLGIPPGLFVRISNEFILGIRDISDLVREGREKLGKNGRIEELMIP